MTYKASWNSLKQHLTPQWLRDAKFGIYTHWGAYSVPAFGPNVSLYFYNMYCKGTPQYDYHVKTYGGPQKFGYKDFIPMFKGEKFDADEWAELFKKAGAKFAGPVGEHHDGFSMWNSSVNEWNSANMGPKRDVVGELEKAVRKQGMKYFVAFHHAESWFAYPHWMKEYDTSDPRYQGLYGEPHNLDLEGKAPLKSWVPQVFEEWHKMHYPSKAFLNQWLGKIEEVINQYSPDMLWFDFGLEFIQEHYKREMLSYYYNKAEELGKEVIVGYKYHNLAPGSGIVDLEQGRFNEIAYNEWITDTTIDEGCAWGYMNGAKYKTATTLLHYLIDNVSKNGYMLLNVGPMANGKIPDEANRILLDMGKWLEINGEAIFGTTTWIHSGEGPTKMEKTGAFTEDEKLCYTSQDFRFTVKEDTIYAICLNWPKDEALITTVSKSASKLYNSEIKVVTMLGNDGELPWKMTEKGLHIATPSMKPCDHAYVFKIERKHPFI